MYALLFFSVYIIVKHYFFIYFLRRHNLIHVVWSCYKF